MTDYQQRFEQILIYIDKNLDNEISIKSLSDLAFFSPFHFHRQFSAYIGQPLKQYIYHLFKSLKIMNLSYQLTQQHTPITRIAHFFPK